MFRMIVQLAASARAVLRHAPTNRLLQRLHLRRGSVPAVAAVLVGLVYLFAAGICTVLLDRGGPGWLNLLVLLFIYNSAKLVLHGLAMIASPACSNAITDVVRVTPWSDCDVGGDVRGG